MNIGRCPHQIIVETNLDNKSFLRKSKPCELTPLSNGWCFGHQESHEIMQIGASCGYRGLALGPLEIGTGYAWWYAFAQIARPGRARQIGEAISREESR